MLFNSYIFVFMFLPMTLIGYFWLNHQKKYKVAQVYLFIMSLWFYGYFNYFYLLIILSSICINYIVSRFMQTAVGIRRKIFFVVALLFNTGLIFYYKYFNFFVENINMLFSKDIMLQEIIMPLGISFFTIQQISYIVDVYKGVTKAAPLLPYTVYVSFFPQLVAGPILRYDEIIPQIEDMNKKQFDWNNFVKGVYRFVLGLSKKVLVADMFGVVADYGFSSYVSLNGISVLLAMFAYTIQIYFDFSGYSDMAIGIGSMFNLNLPENFVSPYKSLTIVEFWSKWHLTLTRFLREYIYFPLGGSRKGVFRTYVNIMIVFLVSGIWHGANWTFILWGIIHGIAQCFVRMYQNKIDKIPKVVLWISNFIFIMLTWTLFRADSITHFIDMVMRLGSWESTEINSTMLFNVIPMEISSIIQFFSYFTYQLSYIKSYIAYLILAIVLWVIVKGKNTAEITNDFSEKGKSYIYIAILAYICVLSFSNVSSFIYFNF